jgi:hypothetical protein
MRAQPFQVRRSALLIAGATGVLGNEVLRRLAGLQQFTGTRVLAREPIKAGWHAVTATVVAGDAPEQWPPVQADTAIVLFDPPRLFYDRERALWTPRPEQLPELARWLRAGGVRTLAVVLPHVQFRLPEALKRGLAGLDEHAVAALGFERLLIVRSAQGFAASSNANLPTRLARWMLSVFKYMVPSSEQPVRAVKVAEFVALALQLAPSGIHVAAPETVWRAAQGDMRSAVVEWLAP